MGCGHDSCGCGGGSGSGHAQVEDPMAAFVEMAALAPEHKHLEAFIGEWNAEVKIWMGQGEPQVTRGVMVNTFILGGRFIEQKYQGHGYDFQGSGLFGYNKASGKFEGLWIDTMSTMMQTDIGTYDPGKKTFTMLSKVNCSEMGEMTRTSLIKVHGPDKHVMEMYFAPQGGTEDKCMEITYTRRK
ncbi:MAG: DUF1579 domain-containing protein [Leptolyngbya sp. PLA3]|nr:MAG: DUF1579 domain-containing protein [Cyanobacteria bacterium CYA]MCE7968689.1 DUF1579 domain-containing protein [Leptolyngbya sp. PL-A3]